MPKIFFLLLVTFWMFPIYAQDKTTKPPGPNDNPVSWEDIKILKSQMNSFVASYNQRTKQCRHSKSSGMKVENLLDVYLDLAAEKMRAEMSTCAEAKAYEVCMFEDKERREKLDKLINDPAFANYMKSELKISDGGIVIYQYFRDLIQRVKIVTDD